MKEAKRFFKTNHVVGIILFSMALLSLLYALLVPGHTAIFGYILFLILAPIPMLISCICTYNALMTFNDHKERNKFVYKNITCTLLCAGLLVVAYTGYPFRWF